MKQEQTKKKNAISLLFLSRDSQQTEQRKEKKPKE